MNSTVNAQFSGRNSLYFGRFKDLLDFSTKENSFLSSQRPDDPRNDSVLRCSSHDISYSTLRHSSRHIFSSLWEVFLLTFPSVRRHSSHDISYSTLRRSSRHIFFSVMRCSSRNIFPRSGDIVLVIPPFRIWDVVLMIYFIMSGDVSLATFPVLSWDEVLITFSVLIMRRSFHGILHGTWDIILMTSQFGYEMKFP